MEDPWRGDMSGVFLFSDGTQSPPPVEKKTDPAAKEY